MIPMTHMVTLIEHFRKICFKLYPEDIDTLTEHFRNERFGTETPGLLQLQLRMGLENEPILLISRHIKTPRLLKLVLRKTYRTWQHLHGEIDFDDMLIANVLRFGAPEAFEFLLENIIEIRSIQVGINSEAKEKRLTAIENKWTQLAKVVDWDTSSAKGLIQFLFPTWQDKYYPPKKSNYQGLQVENPTDYWPRFLNEELEIGEIRDQEILSGLRKWKDNPDGRVFHNLTLSSLLCSDEAFVEKFEHFAPLFLNGLEIRRIAAAVFSEAIKLLGVKAKSDSVPGFLPLWRKATRQPIDEKEHLKWVQEEIFKALPVSLQFANDIYYYWKSNSELYLYDKKARIDLRKGVISKTKAFFENDPARFVSTLDPDSSYISIHLCKTFSSIDEGGEGFVPADWKWFGLLLLDAGDLNPQVIVPQIVPFIIKVQHLTHGYSFSFNNDGAEELFGDELPRLMKLVSQEIDLSHFDPQETGSIEQARETAKQWLVEYNKVQNA